MQPPTLPFFVKLRNWSLILAAVSGTILTTPVALPTTVVQVASYLAVAGTVASAVSQAVTDGKQER
jgi:predicted benzoate:H+ symporter BenE